MDLHLQAKVSPYLQNAQKQIVHAKKKGCGAGKWPDGGDIRDTPPMELTVRRSQQPRKGGESRQGS